MTNKINSTKSSSNIKKVFNEDLARNIDKTHSTASPMTAKKKTQKKNVRLQLLRTCFKQSTVTPSHHNQI